MGELREELVNMVDKLAREQSSYEAKQSALMKNIFLLLEGRFVEKLVRTNDTDLFENKIMSLPLDKMGVKEDLLNRFCNDEILFFSTVAVSSLILGCLITSLIFLVYSIHADRLVNRTVE